MAESFDVVILGAVAASSRATPRARPERAC